VTHFRLTFDFDPAKAASNLRRHGVSFREAMTVFDDPLAQTFPDELHSEKEDRSIPPWLIIETPAAVCFAPGSRKPHTPHRGATSNQSREDRL
jgi:uncharacterized DUF497 family protein